MNFPLRRFRFSKNHEVRFLYEIFKDNESEEIETDVSHMSLSYVGYF